MDCMLIPTVNHRTATQLARTLYIDIDMTYESIKSRIDHLSQEPCADDEEILYLNAIKSSMYDIDRSMKKLCSNLFIEDIE